MLSDDIVLRFDNLVVLTHVLGDLAYALVLFLLGIAMTCERLEQVLLRLIQFTRSDIGARDLIIYHFCHVLEAFLQLLLVGEGMGLTHQHYHLDHVVVDNVGLE